MSDSAIQHVYLVGAAVIIGTKIWGKIHRN